MTALETIQNILETGNKKQRVAVTKLVIHCIKTSGTTMFDGKKIEFGKYGEVYLMDKDADISAIEKPSFIIVEDEKKVDCV